MINRKSKSYQSICPECSRVRNLTYAQDWNIKNKKSSGRCPGCNPNMNLSGLEKGRGWNKGIIGFKKGHRPYFVAFGDRNPAWKGGITPANTKIRNSKEYSEWRISVFIRDKYTCQICFTVGGKLNADHIIPFCASKEKRLDLNNGRTLCFNCHLKTDTYAYKALKYATNV